MKESLKASVDHKTLDEIRKLANNSSDLTLSGITNFALQILLRDVTKEDLAKLEDRMRADKFDRKKKFVGTTKFRKEWA